MSVLKFAPLESCVDPSFWSELGDRKLDSIQLSEASVPIYGYLSPSRYNEVPSRLFVDSTSFDDTTHRQGTHKVQGSLVVFNTLDAFRKHDKAGALNQVGGQVWQDIRSGAAAVDASRLSHFLLLTYGDLKQFHFNYWFAFPALKPPTPFVTNGPAVPLAQALDPAGAAAVAEACDRWRGLKTASAAAAAQEDEQTQVAGVATGSSRRDAAVTDEMAGSSREVGSLAHVTPSTASVPPEAAGSTMAGCGAPFWLIVSKTPSFSGADAVALSSYEHLAMGLGQQQQRGDEGGDVDERHVMLAFSDPCQLAGHPGWPLRNLLLMAAVRWGLREVQVLCVRDARGSNTSVEQSLVLRVQLPAVPEGWPAAASKTVALEAADATATATATATAAASGAVNAAELGDGSGSAGPSGSAGGVSCEAALVRHPEVVGWEADEQGKLRARFLDLSAMMNPVALATQAVDLNLRLMRWRAAPTLRVDRMASTKCLLLGAGTLGCAVARTLLAWGVRHVTFVDSSTVSYSNPVRQSLFVFEDCQHGGRPKAAAAAEALTRIFPAVEASSHRLSIPMPGHPPTSAADAEAMARDAATLDDLVSRHDAVFLLTDTRESRWLPSLLAAHHGKIAITSAVGFDSFVVMRHGAPPLSAGRLSCGEGRPEGTAEAGRLGCYFCNDVVAPLNSTIGRTLDQQCTVARPGLAPIAGAIAVELLAALLQHPAGVAAPTPNNGCQSDQRAGRNHEPLALGGVPHMVRGCLNGFEQTCMEARAYSQCTACSPVVVEQYRAECWQFVLRAIEDPSSLEELTGLTGLQHSANCLLDEDDAEDDAGPSGLGTEAFACDDWVDL